MELGIHFVNVNLLGGPQALGPAMAATAQGGAWYDREHTGLGIPFPPIGQRFEMLEETLLICEQMWSDNNEPFEGKHYRLAETLCVPRPIQQSRPPILIGGAGENGGVVSAAPCRCAEAPLVHCHRGMRPARLSRCWR